MNRLVRVVAATLLVAAALVNAPATRAVAAGEATLTLTAQPYAIAPGASWRASFDVVGDLGTAASATAPPTSATPTSATPSAASTPSSVPSRPTVEVRVQAHRVLDDRAELRDVLDGNVPPTVSRVTMPVALIGSSDEATFDVTVPTTNDPDTPDALVLARAGLYPVTVDLLVDGELAGSHVTFVERLPAGEDTDPPLQIALVATVADPGPRADATAVTTATQAVDDVATASAAAGAMTVLLPPTIVDQLAGAQLDAVRAGLAGAEVLAAPALPLDPSSAAAANQVDTFSSQLRDGEDLLGAALPANPPQRSAWLSATPISSSAAAMLRDPLGFDLLVLDRDVYDSLDGSIGGYHDQTLAFEVALDEGASLPGMVVHPASRWLAADAPGDDDMSAVDRAIAVMAELRVTRSELGADVRRSAVLEVPSGATPDPAVLTALTGYATTTPGTALARLGDLPSGTDVMILPDGEPEVVSLPATAGVDLAARVERINLTRLGAAGAGSMLVDQSRAEAWDGELDELVSTSIDDDAVDARLAAIDAEIAAVHDCIDMPEPFTFTLTGRSSPLRLNLTNTCDEDLRVVVHPTSSKLSFPNGDVAKTLVANDVTEVTIDVESRTNGTSAIGIELLTPAHSLRLPQTLVLTARVNALSGLGQVVTGGALLVLLSWWYGHFRKRRRVRRAMLGEVDNPVHLPAMSPDAAEVAINGSTPAGVTTPTDSVTQP